MPEIVNSPEVFLVASTEIKEQEIERYLKSIGDPEWRPDPNVSGGENLVTFGGKACYRSWEAFDPDKPNATNANVSRVRNDPKEYIGNILKSGHGSVLEHANVSFMFKDVSRVFTHELVRHRAGAAYSQESLRFVRLTDLRFWMPDSLTKPEEIFPKEVAEGVITTEQCEKASALISMTLESCEKAQKGLADIFGIESMKNFGLKKKLTSMFRRVAPIGLSTSILCTMNLRTARHIIGMRSHPSAEEEIMTVINRVAEILKEEYPLVFQDMNQRDDGTWEFNHFKV